VRRSEEPPREVRLHQNVRIVGTQVGEPGGVLHHLRMPEESAEGESGLINGSLVVISPDGCAPNPTVESTAGVSQNLSPG